MTIISHLGWEWLRGSNRTDPNYLAALFGFAEPPVNVLSILAQMEVGAHYLPATSDYEGVNALVSMRGGRPDVFVHPHLSTVDQRFMLAHSLGHLMLHPLEKGPVLFSDRQGQPDSYLERDANRFAAGLLVPSQILGATAHLGTPAQLARAFDVSPHVMNSRLRELYGRR